MERHERPSAETGQRHESATRSVHMNDVRPPSRLDPTEGLGGFQDSGQTARRRRQRELDHRHVAVRRVRPWSRHHYLPPTTLKPPRLLEYGGTQTAEQAIGDDQEARLFRDDRSSSPGALFPSASPGGPSGDGGHGDSPRAAGYTIQSR